MKNKNIFTFIFFILSILFLNLNAFSQKKTDANVVGHVTCGSEHLPFVNIVIKGTTIGAATDVSGHYMMTNLPEGKYTLVVHAIGYKSQEKEMNLCCGKTYEVNFELKEDNIGLEQLVITGDRNEKNRREASVIVNTVTAKQFQAVEATTLAEGITFTPGLRVENNCQNCGFTQLRMNGLDGPYSQILINSRPIMSGLAGVYGLEHIPASLIQRVEVVRGGGSALYGGNAIAGTVNIITKDPINNTYEANIKSGIVGLGVNGAGSPETDYTATFNASVVNDANTAGLFIFGLNKKINPWDANNDDFCEIGKVTNTSAGMSTYYRPSDLSRISLDFNTVDEFRRGGNDFEKLPHESTITEQTEHQIYSGNITFETYTSASRENKFSLYTSGQKIDRSSYYGANQDPSCYGKTDDNTISAGAQISLNFDKLLFAPSTFLGGVDLTNSTLTDKKLGYLDTNGIHTENTIVANQTARTFGSYLQNEWKLGKLRMLLGLRYDHYDVDNNETEENVTSGNVIVPRASLMYDLKENLQFRLSYATGYRSPQIFDEDLHIESSQARRVIHVVDPNLKAEHSQSFSGSVDYSTDLGDWQTRILIEGFYTKLEDPFVNHYSDKDEFGNIVSERTNADDATVFGTNIELNAAPSKDLQFTLGTTIQKSKYETALNWGDNKENKTNRFLRSPSHYGFWVVNYKLNPRFSMAFTGTYTGSMDVPHLAVDASESEFNAQQVKLGNVLGKEELLKTEEFLEMGLKLSYKFKLGDDFFMQLTGGVNNILNSYQSDFDKGGLRDAGFIYGPNRPRYIYFGIKIGNSLL